MSVDNIILKIYLQVDWKLRQLINITANKHHSSSNADIPNFLSLVLQTASKLCKQYTELLLAWITFSANQTRNNYNTGRPVLLGRQLRNLFPSYVALRVPDKAKVLKFKKQKILNTKTNWTFEVPSRIENCISEASVFSIWLQNEIQTANYTN